MVVHKYINKMQYILLNFYAIFLIESNNCALYRYTNIIAKLTIARPQQAYKWSTNLDTEL